MSILKEVKLKSLDNTKYIIETFAGASEVVEVSRNRKYTDSSFHDMSKKSEISYDFTGVHTYEEALDLLKHGHQKSVDRMKSSIKANFAGQGKRIQFHNDVVGFQPVVPLAMMGIPNCMVNSSIKPMKGKVVNIYYDSTFTCGVDKKQIEEVGSKLLAAIIEIEAQGYRVNLSVIQSYRDGKNRKGHLMIVKVKSANQPLDLKRCTFPLVHPAFFRVIGFDWYGKVPNGQYNYGYGRGMGYEYNQEKVEEAVQEITKEKCVVFVGKNILDKDMEYLKDVMTGKSKS